MKRQYEEAEKDAEIQRLVLRDNGKKVEGAGRVDGGERVILAGEGHTTDGAAQGKRPKKGNINQGYGTETVDKDTRILVGVDGVKIKQERMEEGAEVERAKKEAMPTDIKTDFDIIEIKDTESMEIDKDEQKDEIAEGWEADINLLYADDGKLSAIETMEEKAAMITKQTSEGQGIINGIRHIGAAVGKKVSKEYQKLYNEELKGKDEEQASREADLLYDTKDNEGTEATTIDIDGTHLNYEEVYNKYIMDGVMSFEEMKIALQKTEREKQNKAVTDKEEGRSNMHSMGNKDKESIIQDRQTDKKNELQEENIGGSCTENNDEEEIG